MADIDNKTRLFKVMDILENETDINHELSIEEIINKLYLVFDSRYNVEKRTIRNDIEILRRCGHNIVVNNGPKGEKYYSRQERLFETYQLRILSDLLRSAKFMPEKDIVDLLNQLKKLTSRHLSEKLDTSTFVEKMIVTDSSGIKLNIDKIHNAVRNREVLKFQYGNYDVNKEFILHHDAEFYEVEPYGVVFDNGFYYLVAFNRKHKKIINYRIDRIRNAINTKEYFERDFFDMGKHLKSCFLMYPGEVCNVEIKFHKHLINAVIDRFGIDINTTLCDDEHFVGKRQIAPTLIR